MKKLSFFLMAMLFSVMSFAAESLLVTLDFSKNTWGLPVASANKTTATVNYTSGDYTITLAGGGSGNGHYYNNDGYLMLGKSGATLTLPAFDFKTTKIVVTGRTGASTSVLQNIYVGSTAVSTQTKGAAVTNTYAIAEDYQAAGNVYVLKVSSGHNTQIVKMEIYGEEGGEQGEKVDAPKFSVTETNFNKAFDLTISSAEGTTLKYTTDNTDPKTSETAVAVETNTANVAIPAKSTVVNAVAVKGDLVSVVASKIYAYINSPETAYTVAEAMEVIDAGLGLENELYVKGEISEIETFNATYGSITYWIKDEEGNKFECYSGLGLNKAKFTSVDDLVVGSKVVVCGVMKKYGTTYEFNYNNYIVSLELPVAKFTVTATAENGTVEGDGEYIENAEVTLTATAAEGYEFVNWTKGEEVVSTENPYTFVVTADVALVANFKEVVVEEPVEAKLYLTPNANWLKDNARFAVYFYGNGETWVSMTKVAGETDLYEVTIPTDKKYPNVIFCRMNPSAAANNWDNKWNQTDDLVIPTDGKNHYTVKENTWDKGGGTWSIWPVPTVKTYVDITITVTANAPASIKWANAGDKLADATEYVAMTAGENNTYTYTLAQVDEFKGVDYTVKVGETVSATQNTSKNVTVDFKALLPQVAVQGVNNWDGTDKMTIADDYLTASITLPLVAKKYDLKLTVDGAWKGHKNENHITREKNSSVFKNDDGNGSITADIAGDYVFTYTYATQTLTVTYPELVTTITATFDLTQAGDTRNMGGAYVIYAGDYTLRIYGYNGAGTYQDDPTTEEDAAPMLFTPDYDDALDAVVVVTIDEENNKEVMQVTATSADGKKIYNLTINIALPSYETFNYAAIGVTAVPETEEGFTTYALEGEFDNEGTPLPFELYATTEPASVMGTIGEEFVLGEGENVAFFIEADNSFFLMAKLQDEQGNIYNIEMTGTVAASQDVEIVVAKEENITLYNLNLNVQGNMAMVSAGNDALSFWLTLLPTENYYGGYMNDAFSNIWYGENQLYAAYGDMHLYGDNNGQVMFVVSFITTPDAEGNVTKYNFTLYPGDQPVDSKHTVTITVYPEGAGTVTGAGEYEDGAEVTVTAEANEGYIFLGWMEDGEFVANDSKYTFTILNDVDLVAVYATQLLGVAEDLVITETALTATAILSTGTKLTVNLVLGEYDKEQGGYWLAETTTLTLGDKELTFLEGLVMVDTEQQKAIAAVLAENEGVFYAFTLVLAAPASGVDNINTNAAPRKVIRDGQLIIIKNGVEYNVQGAILK